MTYPLDLVAVFLPLLGAFVAGLFGRVIGDRASQLVTCGSVFVAMIASCVLFNDVALGHAVIDRALMNWMTSDDFKVDWALHIDTLTAVMLVVVNGVSAMVHIYSVGYMSHDKSIPRFMAYLSLFTFFMLMLVTSNNLVQMFFGWEGVGLASYLLINFWYVKDSANNAAMKAFLVNRVGDFGFALGIFGCFVLFGSVQFTDIFAKAPQELTQFMVFGHSVSAVTVVCLLLFVGAMGKSAQLGLHTWLPDAMEGPTPVSALIHAATMVTAGVFMIARLSPLFEYAPDALAIIAVIGALTAIVAATIGLTQFDIKRVIAYSTMSQLGYMFFAIGVSAYPAAIFHLMTHAFFKALLFLGAGSVIHALSGEQDMRKMGGIRKKIPFTYAYMWIGSLALAGIGIPDVMGMAGFYSKDFILEADYAASVTDHQHFAGMFAYVIGLIAAFMTAFYSWRLLLMTFHGKFRGDRHALDHAHESPLVMLLPLVPLALGAIFAGKLGYDFFVGEDSAAFWNGSILMLGYPYVHDGLAELGDVIHYAHEMPAWVDLAPLGVALAGILLAYVFYVWMPGLPARVTQGFGGLYRLVYNKYYFDELYDRMFTRMSMRLGHIFWKTGDGAIDYYGPDGVAGLVMRLAQKVGALETGYIYHYAFAMLVGVAALVSWFCLRG